jgi:hypothetical protein
MSAAASDIMRLSIFMSKQRRNGIPLLTPQGGVMRTSQHEATFSQQIEADAVAMRFRYCS